MPMLMLYTSQNKPCVYAHMLMCVQFLGDGFAFMYANVCTRVYVCVLLLLLLLLLAVWYNCQYTIYFISFHLFCLLLSCRSVITHISMNRFSKCNISVIVSWLSPHIVNCNTYTHSFAYQNKIEQKKKRSKPPLNCITLSSTSTLQPIIRYYELKTNNPNTNAHAHQPTERRTKRKVTTKPWKLPNE